jgi:hypothetical protein
MRTRNERKRAKEQKRRGDDALEMRGCVLCCVYYIALDTKDEGKEKTKNARYIGEDVL